MGGYMVSLMPQEAKKYCDSVIIGDVEGVWQEVLEDINNNSLQPFYQKALTQLKTPLPKYELLLEKNIGDFLPVQAGRGCPNVCSFCSVYCLYRGQYLRRDIEEVVRDIKHVKSLGFNKFLLLDDNILSEPSYIQRLCQEIKSLDMKWMSQCSINIGKNEKLLNTVAQSGCFALSFGLESISVESLKSMNKPWAKPDEYTELIDKISRAGIDVSTEMVVGADGDTLESIGETAKFIENNKIAVPRFYIITPIPGTDFYKEMMEEGRICNHDIYSYNGSEAVHIPRNMTPEQLTEAYWQLYNEVFSLKSITKRTLLQRNFLRRPGMHLFYFAVNLYYRHQIKNRITPNII